MASTAMGISLTTETMITPTSGWPSRMSRSTSSPLIPGSCTSSSITSTGDLRSSCSASSPVGAVSGIMPAERTMASMVWRMLGSSSTTSTVAVRDMARV
jgi:hypothetical protein